MVLDMLYECAGCKASFVDSVYTLILSPFGFQVSGGMVNNYVYKLLVQPVLNAIAISNALSRIAVRAPSVRFCVDLCRIVVQSKCTGNLCSRLSSTHLGKEGNGNLAHCVCTI